MCSIVDDIIVEDRCLLDIYDIFDTYWYVDAGEDSQRPTLRQLAIEDGVLDVDADDEEACPSPVEDIYPSPPPHPAPVEAPAEPSAVASTVLDRIAAIRRHGAQHVIWLLDKHSGLKHVEYHFCSHFLFFIQLPFRAEMARREVEKKAAMEGPLSRTLVW